MGYLSGSKRRSIYGVVEQVTEGLRRLAYENTCDCG